MRAVFCAHDDSENTGNGGCLIVAVEAHGAAEVECALEVAVAVEHGQDAHEAVEVGIPDGFGHGVLVHVIFVGDDLAGLYPVVGILAEDIEAFFHSESVAVVLREIPETLLDEFFHIFLEESFGIHGSVECCGLYGPGVAGDACRPVAFSDCVGRHARGGVGPDFVDELRVDLIPVWVEILTAGERRRVAEVHQAEGGTVGQPHTVADVVHPSLAHLGVGGIDAVFFHQREVDVLHVGVVVGEGSVIFLKFVDVLGVAEREARFGCRLVNKFVLERESVDVADHLADPSAGDFVAEYVGRYFFGCCGAGRDAEGYGCRREAVGEVFHCLVVGD